MYAIVHVSLKMRLTRICFVLFDRETSVTVSTITQQKTEFYPEGCAGTGVRGKQLLFHKHLESFCPNVVLMILDLMQFLCTD